MSAADDVATYLDSLGLADLNANLFVGNEPPLPTQSLTLTIYDTGGAPTENWAGHEDPTIQVRCRAQNYLTGYDKLVEIKAALLPGYGFNYGDWHYTGFWLITDVAKIGRDDKNREIFTVNFRLMREPLET